MEPTIMPTSHSGYQARHLATMAPPLPIGWSHKPLTKSSREHTSTGVSRIGWAMPPLAPVSIRDSPLSPSHPTWTRAPQLHISQIGYSTVVHHLI
ncbi:unnamed protein product [Tilletia laevis]|uniref:Uncharacterized protein n=1 Tax=Tilletia caries TaxID=13290 RepID=A0ABN7J1D9_9BASI|nr:unnamed protein product [Tilletia caries]CAD6946211.1 unnamed protein product [Tilletia caries]CAD6965700.1 unnamed protein product [Tilletia laevis]